MTDAPDARPTSPDEREVFARAAAGDVAAIERLAATVAPTMRAALAGEIPQRWQSLLTVDDVIQQAWADAVVGIGGFESRGAGSFAAWMITIARHNLLNAIRMLEADKRGGSRVRVTAGRGVDDASYVELLDTLAGDGTTPSRAVSREEARRALDQALDRLPETYRAVVRGYDLEGRSASDVARDVGRTPGAMYMLRARALRTLAELLGAPSGILSRR